MTLKPDLVLTFSDLQADIAATLIREGVPVHAFNQRDVAGIFAMIETLGSLVGRTADAATLVARYRKRLTAIRQTVREPRP